MTFTTTVTVRFAHVDAAGIVFYPRYFEMLNAAVEDWFAAMGMDFRTMHGAAKMGVPTVKLDVTFLSPSELGDVLTVTISPREVGRSSCAFTALFSGDGRDRVRVDAVLVCMDLMAQRSRPWPDALRERLTDAVAPASA